MWSWLSKIDPNTVFAVAAIVGGYIWHRVFPPSVTTKVDESIAAMKAILITAVQTAEPNMTPPQLEVMLRGFAAVQLAKLGYVNGKYPPLLQAAEDAAVHEAIAAYTAK